MVIGKGNRDDIMTADNPLCCPDQHDQQLMATKDMAHIVETAEQCERLTIPQLVPPHTMIVTKEEDKNGGMMTTTTTTTKPRLTTMTLSSMIETNLKQQIDTGGEGTMNDEISQQPSQQQPNRQVFASIQ